MKILEGQSIFDIAIRQFGSVEAAYDIAVKNNISITDDISDIVIDGINVINKPIVNYLSTKNINPATFVQNKNEQLDRLFFPELPVEFS